MLGQTHVKALEKLADLSACNRFTWEGCSAKPLGEPWRSTKHLASWPHAQEGLLTKAGARSFCTGSVGQQAWTLQLEQPLDVSK